MDLENRLKLSRISVNVKESDIQSVLVKTKEAFIQREGECMLSYGEFFMSQCMMIKKRWWCLQMVLLLLAWQFMSSGYEAFYLRRGMGIFATMFVILILPELWKNLMNGCVEIEISSFYSLHRIYAARLLTIGMVDIFLLTVFGFIAHYGIGMTITDIIINLLLPATVTSCICFTVLDRLKKNIGMALALSFVWCIAWWLLASNDSLYLATAVPIWLAVFILACILLAWCVRHLLNHCDRCMEVRFGGTILS